MLTLGGRGWKVNLPLTLKYDRFPIALRPECSMKNMSISEPCTGSRWHEDQGVTQRTEENVP